VIEQNRDSQLRSLIVNENGIDPVRLIPIVHYDGSPITAASSPNPSATIRTVSRSPPSQGRLMTYIAKPKFHHPGLKKNELGSPTATTRADLDLVRRLRPRLDHGLDHRGLFRVVDRAASRRQISGIGCSSKTPDYFLGNSHASTRCMAACRRC